MKLIVGLGNPGKEYDGTRHNIGFMAIDNYLKDVSFKEKFNGLYYEKNVNNEKVIFLKPTTFMNNSGEAIRKFVDYYKINIEDVLIIHDDMYFDVGVFKLRESGSSAGHNGIKSIIEHLGTQNFNRIRVGISKPHQGEDTINYVLGKFSHDDKEIIKGVMDKINKVIDDYFNMSFDKLMNKYN